MYFAILNLPNGKVTAMVNNDDELALYDEKKDAVHDAQNTSLGKFYGYEIFEVGNGEYRG